MGSDGTPLLNPLERWSSTLFLAAGGLLLVYAALNGLSAFADVSTIQRGFQLGYVLGFLGLLGLYPSLVDRSRWLTRSGAVAATFGIVGISSITTIELIQLAGSTSRSRPFWSIVVFLTLVGFVLGYLFFGVAVLRSGRYSKAIGLVLLIPGSIVVLMIAHIAAGYASDVTAFVISAGEAMAHLAIGATLRTMSDQNALDAPARDSDVELTMHD